MTFMSVKSSLALENEDVNITNVAEVPKLISDILKQRLLNELEIRKSFPIYFNTKDLSVEQVSYIHRFIDNVNDKISQERGNYRKGQKTSEAAYYKNISKKLPRYGFLPRLVEEFVRHANESNIEEVILSGLLYAEFISISPFFRANAQVARIISKGYLFTRGFDKFQILNIDSYFVEKQSKYYNALKEYVDGNPTKWIELYLQAIIKAFKYTSVQIEHISGRTIRPLANEVIHITERQKTIVELLKKNSQMSGSEIAIILGVSRQNIFVIMQKLLKKKIVEKVGKGTTSRYRLKLAN